jgi:hypothetical protein
LEILGLWTRRVGTQEAIDLQPGWSRGQLRLSFPHLLPPAQLSPEMKLYASQPGVTRLSHPPEDWSDARRDESSDSGLRQESSDVAYSSCILVVSHLHEIALDLVKHGVNTASHMHVHSEKRAHTACGEERDVRESTGLLHETSDTRWVCHGWYCSCMVIYRYHSSRYNNTASLM